MPEYNVSSRKAAAALNVNESTIKRWADSGYLKCIKTPGGHRKFRISDLNEISGKYKLDTKKVNSLLNDKSTEKKINTGNFPALSGAFEKMILKGDSENSYKLLFSLYTSGYELDEIFDKILYRAMYNIGKKWERKQLGIQDEHIASETIFSVLYRFQNLISRNEKISGEDKKAVCFCPENEYHEIGLLCIAILLQHKGWKVINPGVNLPVESMISLVRKENPEIVCMSLKNRIYTENPEFVGKFKYLLKNKIKLIIGGYIENKNPNENFYFCNSALQFNNLLKTL